METNVRSRTQLWSAWQLRYGALVGEETLPEWLEELRQVGQLVLLPEKQCLRITHDAVENLIPLGHWILFSESEELRAVSPEKLFANYEVER